MFGLIGGTKCRSGEVGKNCGLNQSMLLSLSTAKNMSIRQDGSCYCGYWLLLDQTGQCFVSQPCTGWAQLNKRSTTVLEVAPNKIHMILHYAR